MLRWKGLLQKFALLWAAILFGLWLHGVTSLNPPLLRHQSSSQTNDPDTHTMSTSNTLIPAWNSLFPGQKKQQPALDASLGVAAGDRISPSHTYVTGPTATIDTGIVIGTTTSFPAATAPINKFLGIPFARPPLRFSPPQLPLKLSEPLDVTSWGPSCLQQFVYPELTHNFTKAIYNTPAPEESEDCLFLNVYAPDSPPPPGGRTVMFWIFGGAFQFGHAGLPFYDGSRLANDEDVIVVSANYRTNVFGFATSPELPVAEQNLGFLDQRFALAWVQRNIAAFGGSPEKVTIFGESAGAFAIDAHLTSYPANSKLPFRGAILQSGQYSYKQLPDIDPSAAWENLTSAFACPGAFEDNVTCLRAVDAFAIRDYIEINSLTFLPARDNVTLMENPAAQRINGNIANIPVLGGTNSQEGRIFALAYPNFTALAESVLGDYSTQLPEIEAAYAQNTAGIGSSDYDQIAQIFTDFIFQCPQALWANATAAAGIPTWRYYYNASFDNIQGFPNAGSYHATEIPLVFGTYPKEDGAVVSTQQYALSKSMSSAWARFAKNPRAGPGWNPVGTGGAAQVLTGPSGATINGAVSPLSSSLQTAGDELESLRAGTWDLGLFGDRGSARAAGVTIIDQQEVDWRCHFFEPIYRAHTGI